MTIRIGPKAVERAVELMMRRAPHGATGIYISWNGITYGHRTNRSVTPDTPTNYIWFNEAILPSYTETIRGTRATHDTGDTIFLEMNQRQASTLARLTRVIGGYPAGPRGVFDSIQVALHDAGVGVDDYPEDNPVIGGSLFYSSDEEQQKDDESK